MDIFKIAFLLLDLCLSTWSVWEIGRVSQPVRAGWITSSDPILSILVQKLCPGSGFSASSALLDHSLSFLCCHTVKLFSEGFLAGQTLNVCFSRHWDPALEFVSEHSPKPLSAGHWGNAKEKWKSNCKCTAASCWCQLSMAFTWTQTFWFLLVIPNDACALLHILLFFSTKCSVFYPDVLRKIFICI